MAVPSETVEPGRADVLNSDRMLAELAAADVPWTDIVVLDSTGSTNTDLAAAVAGGKAISGAVLVADTQSAGRGRLDREWYSQAGATLTFSVYLTAPANSAQFLPLLMGLAVVRAIPAAEDQIALKWPNDVLLDERKAAGILAEAVSGGAVVGCGINVALTAEQLPVPEAHSLSLAGIEVDRSELLARVLIELHQLYQRWADAGYHAEAAGLLAEFRRRCATLGRQVRVQLPDGGQLEGRAADIDDVGQLVVETATGLQAVSVGDVIHLRH